MRLVQLETHAPDSTALAFSPDGGRLAVGRGDGGIVLVAVPAGTPAGTLSGHQARIVDLAFSADGATLASVAEDGALCLWNVATGERQAVCTDLAEPGGLAFLPDGRGIAVACGFPQEFGPTAQSAKRTRYSHGVQVLGLPGLAPQWGSLRHTARATAVGVAPNGRVILSGGMDGALVAYDAQTGKAKSRNDLAAPVYDIVYRPDSKRVYVPAGLATRGAATADALEQRPLPVLVLNGLTLERLRPLSGHTGPPSGGVFSASYSAEGRYLASGGSDGVVRLWDAVSGSCVEEFPEHRGPVRSVAASPDGDMLASCSDDGTLLLRDMRAPVAPQVAPSAPVKRSGCAAALAAALASWFTCRR